ncbi:unnamed protein product [Knipowitschia caucasica]|uniref:Uncharacterized protein n=1 Tax=Knipowitschia caucasica TaxID=637954 RepID=A0AAV2K4I2_KNICA
MWKRPTTPKTEEITSKKVSVIAPSTSQAGIKRPVTQEDREWALSSLAQLDRFTEYMKRTGVTFQESGVFLSDSGLLGGSPDGLVSDDCIIARCCHSLFFGDPSFQI